MLIIPSPDVAEVCARAIVSAFGPATVTETQSAVAEMVLSQVMGVDLHLANLEPISAHAAAAGIEDIGLRHQVVSAMICQSLIDDQPNRERADRIVAYADALGVKPSMLNPMREWARGHRRVMLADFLRGSWHGKAFRQEFDDKGPVGIVRELTQYEGWTEDPAEAARWADLANLPGGSWGRSVWEFYDRHGWPLPGQPHSVPYPTTHHDWVHVLSGYDATPLGEILVCAFMSAGMPPDIGFSMLFWGLSIYETADIHVVFQPGGKRTIAASPDGPAQFADALRRGAACTVDALDLDHFALASESLVEMRSRFEIPPKMIHGDPEAVPSLPA